MASNAPGWQSGDWLRLTLLLLLVDAGWGTLWNALAITDWALPLDRLRSWRKARALAVLPYTLSDSPGDAVVRRLGNVWSWWREVFLPHCGSALRAILVALPLTMLLGTLIGPSALLLSGAALALMQLGVIWESGRGSVPPGWDGLIAVALPWFVGHAAFSLVTLPSAGLALLFALAWGSTWGTPARRSCAILIGTQIVAAIYLMMLRRPLAAGTLLLLLVPQGALLPWMPRVLSTPGFVRHARPWLMIAMAVAALVL